MEEKTKRNKTTCTYLGIMLLMVVASYFIYDHFMVERELKQEEQLIEDYIKPETEVVNLSQETILNETKEKVKISYSMILEIPKINLKKGLCSIGQSCNNVSKNIEILKESDMPSVINGNLFLAGHNGNSKVSFFNKLDRLSVGDSIYIYYDGYKYEYKLNNYYDIKKTGEANIKRDKNKTTLVLVTCKKNTKDKQVIYVAYLENKSEY